MIKCLFLMVTLMTSVSSFAQFKSSTKERIKELEERVTSLEDKFQKHEEEVTSRADDGAEIPRSLFRIGSATDTYLNVLKEFEIRGEFDSHLSDEQKILFSKLFYNCLSEVKKRNPDKYVRVRTISVERHNEDRGAYFFYYTDGADLKMNFTATKIPSAQQCYDIIVTKALRDRN